MTTTFTSAKSIQRLHIRSLKRKIQFIEKQMDYCYNNPRGLSNREHNLFRNTLPSYQERVKFYHTLNENELDYYASTLAVLYDELEFITNYTRDAEDTNV